MSFFGAKAAYPTHEYRFGPLATYSFRRRLMDDREKTHKSSIMPRKFAWIFGARHHFRRWTVGMDRA